jgi:hypothetical protein
MYKKSDNYEFTGSDTMLMNRGNLLRPSTSSNMSGWATVKTTEFRRFMYTADSKIKIAFEGKNLH